MEEFRNSWMEIPGSSPLCTEGPEPPCWCVQERPPRGWIAPARLRARSIERPRMMAALELVHVSRRMELGRKRCAGDVGNHAALCDGDASEKLVELWVIPDDEQQVTGDDTTLVVLDT